MNLSQSLTATVDIRHTYIYTYIYELILALYNFFLGAQNPCSFCSPENKGGLWSQESGDHYGSLSFALIG